MRVYLLVMLLAAAVTYLTTPAARWVARRTHAITAVRDRDIHVTPTLRLGGLAIFAGILVAVVIASQMTFLEDVFAGREVWGIIGAALLVTLLGWADDVWDLDWMTKLAGQILAAGFMALNGVQLTTWPIPGQLTIPGSRLSLLVTIFVVVATMNAINFIDGLDGLAAGVVAIGGSAYFFYAYFLSQQTSPQDLSSLAALMLAVLVGACIGFLPHNFHPSHIFMGDAGALVLGVVLSGATISVTGHLNVDLTTDAQAIPAFVPILLPFAVLVLPILDMTLAVVRRVAHGHSPFSPDRRHLHHRLLRLGHSHRRAVLTMYVWTFVFAYGAAAMVLYSLQDMAIGLGIAVVVAIVVTLGPLRTRGRILDDEYVAATTGQIPMVRVAPSAPETSGELSDRRQP